MKKKQKIGRWLVVILALVLGVLLLRDAGSDEGLIGLYRSYRERRKTEAQIRRMNHLIDSLEARIERLHSDTAYIERIAREKLGMARPDERVYKFVEEEERAK